MELQEHKCCDMKRVYKGAWTPEEDAILIAYMKTHGNQGQSWSRIATHAGTYIYHLFNSCYTS